MSGAFIILIITAALILLGIVEAAGHRRNLRRIPVRIHVNGTRGKSSVTRLIAAGLREGGIRTCAKTTGTLPRMILPDASEIPVFRPAGPNVVEQIRIVRAAAAYDARALVIECMAIQPELQWLSEARLIKATHGVITNVRADHLEVMGPRENDVALALAGSIPVRSKVFTAERRHLDALRKVAADRQSVLVEVGEKERSSVGESELAGFSYTEHPENVALALAVCADLGIGRETALRGMSKVTPDSGAMTEHEIDFFGKRLVFINGFAANDPESTEVIWNMATGRHGDVERRIAVFNGRGDRPDRSMQLGRACVHWRLIDHIVLIGTGTYLFARAAISEGFEISKITVAEDRRVEEIFEIVVGMARGSTLVMGMGNIGGHGLEVVRFFRNRATPKEAA